jgi:hypothetical protein
MIAIKLPFPCHVGLPTLRFLLKMLAAVVAFLLLSARAAWGDPTTPQRAEAAVLKWLEADPRPLGAPLARRVGNVRTFNDGKGSPLYHVVELAPSGFVIVAGDDLVEPIIAFSASGRYDPSTANALGALVSRDLPSRVGSARAIGAAGQAGAPQLLANPRLQARRRKWEFTQPMTAQGAGMRLGSVSDVRVDPLVQSRWSQGSVGSAYCYNTYTPNHYVCGCVATAMAQILRFYRYPTTGVGTASFTIYVDGKAETRTLRGGDGNGGPYRWDLMPLVPGSTTTEAERQAIGALCYDAGLSVNMQYSSSGSGAYSIGGEAFVRTFRYSNAIEASSWGNLGQALNHMVNTNLDAGQPVALGVFGDAGGHAVVCDGYGYNFSTLYHHLNLGWAGSYDAWYNLPNIDAGYQFTSVDLCLYNVCQSGTGEVLSGRVTNAQGQPISGASITATRSGGGTYTAATNAKGIWSLARLPSASTYTVACAKSGYSFGPKAVSVGTSRSSQSTTGNVWGVDFGGPPPLVITTTSLPSGTVGTPYSATLQATGGATPYQWAVVPTEALAAQQTPAGGTATGWRGDDQSWRTTLPFPFPFFGTTYTALYVCSNGFLDFANSYPDYSNTTDELKSNLRIAPLWADLKTDGTAQPSEGIYVYQPDADSIAFRWVGETYSGRQPVNFEAVLRRNGDVEFHYGAGNSSVSPTVGLSGGNGVQYVLSAYNGVSSLGGARTALYKPLHPGLSLNAATGQLSGTPTAGGTRTLRFIATGADGATASKDLPLAIAAPPAPPLTVDATATPAEGTAPLTVQFSAQVSGGALPQAIDLRQRPILAYGGSEDRSSTVTIEENGATFHIVGNGWKAIRFPYRVTANTILAFEFRSTRQGDIHAIGLDTNLSPSPAWMFRVYGTESYGNSQGLSYASSAPAWKAYEIPLGSYLTGSMNYLVFINDHDVASPNAQSYFRSVRVFEQDARYAYRWDFGDGQTSTQLRPSHVYRSPGTYAAQVTVTDLQRRQGSDALLVSVRAVGTRKAATSDEDLFSGGSSLPRLDILGERAADFGPYFIGEIVGLNLAYRLRNSGAGTLHGTISVAAPFRLAIDDGPPARQSRFALEPGEEMAVTVIFAPSQTGSFEVPIFFDSEAGTQLRFAQGHALRLSH